jgi:hypothetical protein
MISLKARLEIKDRKAPLRGDIGTFGEMAICQAERTKIEIADYQEHFQLD